MHNYSTLRHDPIPDPDDKPPALLVVSGTTGRDGYHHYYGELLDQDRESRIPAKKRNLHPLKGGFAPFDDVAGDMLDKFDRLHEATDSRFYVVGHSLGGALATLLALERPDAVEGVACLAGAQEGVHPKAIMAWALKAGFYNRKKELTRYADDIHPESDFIQKLKTRMAQDWSEDIPLTLYSAPPLADILVSAPQGLRAQLPEGQTPERLVVTPNVNIFGKKTLDLVRRFPAMPQDVEILHSKVPAGHINMPRLDAVKNHVNQKRLRGYKSSGQMMS